MIFPQTVQERVDEKVEKRRDVGDGPREASQSENSIAQPLDFHAAKESKSVQKRLNQTKGKIRRQYEKYCWRHRSLR